MSHWAIASFNIACLPLSEAGLGLPNYPALAASQFVAAQACVAVAAPKAAFPGPGTVPDSIPSP
eukprot:3019624-Prorocentrum_lima.AAC.1